MSVVLCCHNSAARLPPTLDHLVRQIVPAGLAWEVIVVDNASTDGTAALARNLWRPPSPTTLEVVTEERLGLSHARVRGIRAARYNTIVFADDDNWLASDYVATASHVMLRHSSVGICFGHNEGRFEVEPPSWLPSVQVHYAIGSLGDVPREDAAIGLLPWGAGMVLRRRAFVMLEEARFGATLSDRTGTSLASGGDSELALALRIAGWRLRYEPSLRLTHYVPAARLRWSYFIDLVKAQAESSTQLDPYNPAFQLTAGRWRSWFRRRWLYQVARTALRLLRRHPFAAFKCIHHFPEGSSDAQSLVSLRARLRVLLRERSAYTRRFLAFDNWTSRLTGTGPLSQRL